MAEPKLVPVEMLVSMASEKNDRDVGKVVYVSEAERDRLFEKGFACEPSEISETATKGKKAKPPAKPEE